MSGRVSAYDSVIGSTSLYEIKKICVELEIQFEKCFCLSASGSF